jgi:hypothetical protein
MFQSVFLYAPAVIACCHLLVPYDADLWSYKAVHLFAIVFRCFVLFFVQSSKTRRFCNFFCYPYFYCVPFVTVVSCPVKLLDAVRFTILYVITPRIDILYFQNWLLTTIRRYRNRLRMLLPLFGKPFINTDSWCSLHRR